MRNRFASDEKIGRARMPKLFLHSQEDRVIPITLGRRLFEKASGSKRFVTLHGGHDDAFLLDSARYFDAIAAFLLQL
jgi:pimeloyl-ACP methyl ester carboxylesterase